MATQAEDQLARIIYDFVKPRNPHGPQDDLWYGMTYTHDENAKALRIAKAILAAGYVPPPEPDPEALAIFKSLPIGAQWRWLDYTGPYFVKVDEETYFTPRHTPLGVEPNLFHIDEANWAATALQIKETENGN